MLVIDHWWFQIFYVTTFELKTLLKNKLRSNCPLTHIKVMHKLKQWAKRCQQFESKNILVLFSLSLFSDQRFSDDLASVPKRTILLYVDITWCYGGGWQWSDFNIALPTYLYYHWQSVISAQKRGGREREMNWEGKT